jgi:hypothetical protein
VVGKLTAVIPSVSRGIWVGGGREELDREQAEQRRELDDRVHRHRRGVLERIADRVADDRRACSGVPFSFSSTSTIFLALSHAPPALAMKIAW